jgi:hypothetical protein
MMVAAGSSEILASTRIYGITPQKTTILTLSALTSKLTYLRCSIKYDLKAEYVKNHLKRRQILSHEQELSSELFFPVSDHTLSCSIFVVISVIVVISLPGDG